MKKHLWIASLLLTFSGVALPTMQSADPAVRVVKAGNAYDECESVILDYQPVATAVEPPVIALQVLAPAKLCGTNEIVYRIVAHNRSGASAHHVVIHNPVPANTQFARANPTPTAQEPTLQWNLGTMDGGARREITLVLNRNGPGDIQNCVRVTFEHGLCVTTRLCQSDPPPPIKETPPPPVPQPKGRAVLRLNKRGPANAAVGDKLNYQLTVTNVGNAAAENVQLTDDLPAGLDSVDRPNRRQLVWPVGTLAPNESKQADYQVVVRSGGRLCNRAVATGDGGLRDEVENCVNVTDAKLKLRKTGPERANANTPIPYRITVTNEGTTPVTNAILTDQIPNGFSFVNASDNGQLVGGTQVQWQLGTIEPKGNRSVNLTLRGMVLGEYRNQAQVAADGGLKATAEARTDVLGIPSFQLEVVDDADPIEVQEETTYTIRVKNTGTLAGTKIVVTASVPVEMAVTDVNTGGILKHKIDKQLVRFDPFDLEPMREAVFRIKAQGIKVNSSARFRVELTADQLRAGGKVTEEEATTIYNPNPGGG